MKRMVKYITFDAVIEGKKFKKVKLDFRIDADNDSDFGVDKEYLHEEDGPWCVAECGGKMYDFHVYGDPCNHHKLCLECCEMIACGKDVYSHGDFVYDFEYSNVRVRYIRESDLISASDVKFSRICKEEKLDDDEMEMFAPEIMIRKMSEMQWFFSNGEAVSKCRRFYMKYPKKRDLTNDERQEVAFSHFGAFFIPEDYKDITYRMIACCFGEVKLITRKD